MDFGSLEAIEDYSLSDYDSRLSEDERNSLSLLPVETG